MGSSMGHAPTHSENVTESGWVVFDLTCQLSNKRRWEHNLLGGVDEELNNTQPWSDESGCVSSQVINTCNHKCVCCIPCPLVCVHVEVDM